MCECMHAWRPFETEWENVRVRVCVGVCVGVGV